MKTYNPPIRERGKDDLLKIIDSPDEWEDDVLRIASDELTKRGISLRTQERRAKSHSKAKKQIKEIKKNASYSYFQMTLLLVFAPFTLLWFVPSGMGIIELENEGFLRKRNQRFILISLSYLLWFLFISYFPF
ncbi:hypothetical protein [Gracilimonas sediminicola]|uniref:Uncharacterized protein n=1 Tax=Gracilimonas sediminicola TaxID=2952158 RepID=A0A9X2RBI3_9BACT|nr:hypothetical protein [Gracilimonas sediminicola]MCP9290365.1 hypothetical protein [Gracilimonas sediminicola]